MGAEKATLIQIDTLERSLRESKQLVEDLEVELAKSNEAANVHSAISRQSALPCVRVYACDCGGCGGLAVSTAGRQHTQQIHDLRKRLGELENLDKVPVCPPGGCYMCAGGCSVSGRDRAAARQGRCSPLRLRL